jgi:tetratricopeptide (TPR) repeat protein
LLPVHIGKYRLTSRLATGGMAEVYLGRATEGGAAGPTVAVKRLLPHLARETQIVRMFLNEARITAQIDHPNVVRILDLGSDNGQPFIVMELLDGHSFAELRHQAAQIPQRVPLGITLRVLCEACRGLDAAHRAVDQNGQPLAIVHRDFTPENIHVGFNGNVKVIDFGIARAENATSATEPGTLKGKFFYMSPEMIAGRPVDHRADIFAAGVMLYEQLCGRRPFTGTSADEVVDRIAQGRLKRPSELDPSVPPELEAICMMALARNPDQRFASLDVFIASIEAVGGVARIATGEELAGYVAQIFPLEQDEKRQVLMRARAADPSVPVHRQQEAGPTVVMAGEIPRPAAAADAARADPAPPAGALPAPAARPFRWPRRALKWVGLALLPVAAAAAFYLVPRQTPEARIAAAESTQDREERVSRLEPLVGSEEASAGQLARAAQLLLEVSSYDMALAVAEWAGKRYPQDPAAPLLEARACLGLRYGKRAEAALDRAAGLNPRDVEPDLVRAELREAQGDVAGTTEALAAAEKKRPGDPDLLGRKGLILSRLGVLPDAATALGDALQKRFEPRWAAELGYVRLRQDQLGEAGNLLRRALRKDPRLFEGHYYLGALLVKQRDVKGAEKAYREAAQMAPADPRPLVSLCELLIQAGQVPEAKEVQKQLQEHYSKEAALACRPP